MTSDGCLSLYSPLVVSLAPVVLTGVGGHPIVLQTLQGAHCSTELAQPRRVTDLSNLSGRGGVHRVLKYIKLATPNVKAYIT